jgi:hypothetical protein
MQIGLYCPWTLVGAAGEAISGTSVQGLQYV